MLCARQGMFFMVSRKQKEPLQLDHCYGSAFYNDAAGVANP